MRASRYRWLAFAAVLFIVECSILMGLEGPRSAAVRAAFGVYLESLGLRLAHADLRIDAHRLEIANLAIEERGGRRFFSASSVRAAYTVHGATVFLTNVTLQSPRLLLSKAADRSFNIPSRFAGLRWFLGTSIQRSSATLLVRDGRIDFVNAFAPTRSGKGFSLQNIDAAVRFDEGLISRGSFGARVGDIRAASRIVGDFSQNDLTRIAALRLSARHIPLAPIVNYFVSADAFAVEGGAVDVAIRSAASAWPRGCDPLWAVTARGMFYDTRVHVAPLIVPVRDLNGAFSLDDGVLRLPRVTGIMAGLPVAGHGTVSLRSSPRLDLRFATDGPLHDARNVLAFLQPLKLEGNVAVAARIVGTPSDPHVGVAFAMPYGWSLAQVVIGPTQGMLVYSHGRTTLPFATARYAGSVISVSGNVDMGTPPAWPKGPLSVRATD